LAVENKPAKLFAVNDQPNHQAKTDLIKNDHNEAKKSLYKSQRYISSSNLNFRSTKFITGKKILKTANQLVNEEDSCPMSLNPQYNKKFGIRKN
jgi:hypothetical protein